MSEDAPESKHTAAPDSDYRAIDYPVFCKPSETPVTVERIRLMYSGDLPALRIVASGLMDSVGLYVKPKEEDMDKCRFWMKVFGLEGLDSDGARPAVTSTT